MHACGFCEGTFFTEDALEALVERARNRDDVDSAASLQTNVSITSSQSEVQYLPCPMCGERMNRSIFGRKSGIVVDVCSEHGTWFDHGEVERAVRFARTHETLAERAKSSPSAEDIQRRADVVGLHEKENIEGEIADALWHVRMDGSELAWIERIAIAIRWLRGD